MNKPSSDFLSGDKRPPILAKDASNIVVWKTAVENYLNLRHGERIGNAALSGRMLTYAYPDAPLKAPPSTAPVITSPSAADLAAAHIHAAAIGAIPAANTRGGNNAAALAAQEAANS